VTRRLNGYFDCMGARSKPAAAKSQFLGDGILAAFLPPDDANKPARPPPCRRSGHPGPR
jgi:hypothetical protein